MPRVQLFRASQAISDNILALIQRERTLVTPSSCLFDSKADAFIPYRLVDYVLHGVWISISIEIQCSGSAKCTDDFGR